MLVLAFLRRLTVFKIIDWMVRLQKHKCKFVFSTIEGDIEKRGSEELQQSLEICCCALLLMIDDILFGKLPSIPTFYCVRGLLYSKRRVYLCIYSNGESSWTGRLHVVDCES